ncbi:hypothetical protein ACQKJC_13575 [Priestia koreensis]|uniref:hypothetical protein n=1 Tax=Priestia koreensis TaxID=284581 RepID=UPI00203D1599|nr:hypothetical protein [Priestia koreensis]MCM3006123.1 hypothetical protein [Priestia koreensis]
MEKITFIFSLLSLTLSVAIRSVLRANGIHTFLSESVIRQPLIFLVIQLSFLFLFKKKFEKPVR